MVKNPSYKYSIEFLNKTIEVWQPYASTPLSLDDAREISQNMTALFNFLISKEKESKNTDIDKNSS
jgi:flagellin-specific chaperone FliS